MLFYICKKGILIKDTINVTIYIMYVLSIERQIYWEKLQLIEEYKYLFLM